MLYRALKMAFWVANDHLGLVLLLNVACMIPVAMLTGLAFSLNPLPGLLLLVLAYAALVPAFLAALGHVARKLVEEHEARFTDFLHGLRNYALQGVACGLVFGFALTLSLGGAYYYLAVMGRPTLLIGHLFAAICLWCAALFATLAAFAVPALAQKRAGLRVAIKTSLLLLADNPIYCALTTLHLAGLAVFALLPPVFLAFSIVPITILQATAYEMLARKYAAATGEPSINDADDDYLNRGLRDFFFPWKG